MLKKLTQDFQERFLNFETAKGIYLLPAGAFGLWAIWIANWTEYLFHIGFSLVFGYMAFEGLRKVFVNRIKQADRVRRLVNKRNQHFIPRDIDV